MTFEQAMEYIGSVSWLGSRPGLDRITELLRRLGDPQHALKVVHVAGTNGKGSVCAMLESVLRHSGLLTGLYTSPYLVDFGERIRIGGRMISNGEFAEAVSAIRPHADAMADSPTEFELITAAAFWYFREMRVDIVVLETGMGGALDATNVVRNPLCSVITPISLDHTEYLGDTVAKIAGEKAGIIKQNARVVAAESSGEAFAVIEQACSEKNARLIPLDYAAIVPGAFDEVEQSFCYKGAGPYTISLLGEHQIKNAALALEVIGVLNEIGYEIAEKDIERGLNAARWPARFQRVREKPVFLLDGAHNAEGARVAAETFARHYPGKKAMVVFGVLRDKPWREMAALFAPLAQQFVVFTPENARALDGAELLTHLQNTLGSGAVFANSAARAADMATEIAGPNGTVFAVGSLYSAGEILRHFGESYVQL